MQSATNKLVLLVLLQLGVLAGAAWLVSGMYGTTMVSPLAIACAVSAICFGHNTAAIMRCQVDAAYRIVLQSVALGFTLLTTACIALLDADSLPWKLLCGALSLPFLIVWHRLLAQDLDVTLPKRAWFFVAGVAAICANVGWTVMIAASREPTHSQGMGAGLVILGCMAMIALAAPLAGLVLWRGPRSLGACTAAIVLFGLTLCTYAFTVGDRPFGQEQQSGYETSSCARSRPDRAPLKSLRTRARPCGVAGGPCVSARCTAPARSTARVRGLRVQRVCRCLAVG